MLKYRTIILSIFLVLCVDKNILINGGTVAESWISFATEARKLLTNCVVEKNFLSLQQCMNRCSLNLLDKISKCDVIPLIDGIRLKKYENLTNSYSKSRHQQQQHEQRDNHGKNHSGRSNETELGDGNLINSTSNVTNHRQIIDEQNSCSTWHNCIFNMIAQTFDTHVLEIDMSLSRNNLNRGRHRHRNQMLPMMVFGMTALGMVVVPIGFQFLAALGGKALLLAKMALLLASINGLRRVASSGVHYGLYHAQQPHHHQGGWYDTPR